MLILILYFILKGSDGITGTRDIHTACCIKTEAGYNANTAAPRHTKAGIATIGIASNAPMLCITNHMYCI
jgi:hypothetical protein